MLYHISQTGRKKPAGREMREMLKDGGPDCEVFNAQIGHNPSGEGPEHARDKYGIRNVRYRESGERIGRGDVNKYDLPLCERFFKEIKDFDTAERGISMREHAP